MGRLAAGYGWRILTNRPFAEGNERMALAAMVTYLEMNGFTWNCGEVEETAMVQRAAAKGINEDEWEAWVIRNVGAVASRRQSVAGRAPVFTTEVHACFGIHDWQKRAVVGHPCLRVEGPAVTDC